MPLAKGSVPHITAEYVEWLRPMLPRRDYNENTTHAEFLWSEAQWALFTKIEASVPRSMSQNINREVMRAG